MDHSSLGSLDNFLIRGSRVPEADVVPDGVIEQDSVLRDDSNLLPQRFHGQILDVNTVEADRTVVDFEETE